MKGKRYSHQIMVDASLCQQADRKFLGIVCSSLQRFPSLPTLNPQLSTYSHFHIHHTPNSTPHTHPGETVADSIETCYKSKDP